MEPQGHQCPRRFSLRLAKLFENEFILASPCIDLEANILSVVDDLITLGLLAVSPSSSQSHCGLDDNMDEERLVSGYWRQYYRVVPSSKRDLELARTWRDMLAPMLDAYYCTALSLHTLLGKRPTDAEFIKNTQEHIASLLEQGVLKFGK